MNMPNFDDIFDDFQTRPSLRIPPLQDLYPPLSIVSRRPSPLEPNARVNIDSEANKLTGRQRALAQAKPLGAPEHSDFEVPLTTKHAPIFEAQETEHPKERPRKKQKLYDHEQIADFVQLPRPQTKSKDEKPRPFQPISVLNELHEPPPSAALFPPITPNGSQEEHDKYHSGHGRRPSQAKDTGCPPAEKRKPRGRSTRSCVPKRNYTRERTAWTEEETDQLVKGVAIYGMGRWKSILDHPELQFREGRTNMDLKDRFRVVFPPNARHKWTRAMPEPPKDEHDATSGHKSATKISAKKFPLRAPKRLWTQQEDTELDKGFQLYGFQWNLMLKDPALNFDQRSCGQIRDRFRLRFPDMYKRQDSTASPMENPTSSKKKQSERASTWTKKTVPNSNEPANEEESDMGKTGARLAPAFHAEEEDQRLSNSILHNDWDWDENLTLAPLAWEDMATKMPMFPFD
ncbi:hypothetical protein BDR22DRAFT_885042 [Usnea florida]